MVNPDFQMIAKSYNIETALIDKREDLEQGVKEMLEHDGAYFLEVRVGKENNVFPMIPSGVAVSDIRLK